MALDPIRHPAGLPWPSRWPLFVASRRTLLSLVLAAIIPLLLFGAWVVYLIAQEQRADARAQAYQTMKHVGERISSEISAQLQVVESLAASTSLDQPFLSRFYIEAERMKALQPLWATVELADPSGMQILNLFRPLGDTLGPTADRDSFDAVLQTRRSAVGGIGPMGRISGKRLVAIRAPVIRDGELRYVVTVSFLPNAISSILKEAGAPENWVGVVVDSRGNIIARTVAEELEVGRPAAPGLRKAIASAPEGFYVAPTLEGIEVETAFRTLPNTGGWSVHFGVPRDVLNAPVSRSLFVLAGGGIVSLALAFALASLTARDIAQRRRSEAERSALALAVSEERGAVAVEAAELGTWRWDMDGGEVVGSERCWILLDLPRRPQAGSNARISTQEFLDAICEEDRPNVEAAMRNCINDGRTLNVEFRTAHRDGSLHWVRATGRAPHLVGEAPRVVHGVLADIDPQKRAEAERVDLQRRLAEAQENEQRRIARELHDQVGQTVTGLSLGLKALEQRLRGQPLEEQVRWLRHLTSELGRDIHRAAADLRPTALDDLGLKEALNAFASDWSERFGIRADVQFIGSDSRLSPDIETAVYRVVQEALTNVLKHAEASNVSIVLESRADRLRVIIEDDGAGFNPDGAPGQTDDESRRSRPPLGLSGIRERLSLVKGKLHVESAPGEGTTLFIQISLPQEGA
ncbi:sensor histidine kinase [Microvirga roseola]|uniref:sensor histidine kinase n=1 Tax=Microvirga roseola TaxID=2883126 RepID=UPI001E60AB3C|nr:ATP-binding protein [Microvirga roseola]